MQLEQDEVKGFNLGSTLYKAELQQKGNFDKKGFSHGFVGKS